MNSRRCAARALDPTSGAAVERSGRMNINDMGPTQEGDGLEMQPSESHEVDIGMSPTMSILDVDEVGGQPCKKEKEGGVSAAPSSKRSKLEPECCEELDKVTGDGEPVASSSKSTNAAGGLLPQNFLVPVPFGHVDQAGSKYFGTPLKVNFMTFLAGNDVSQQLWYQLKQLLGGHLIGVVSDKKDKEDPNHPAPVTEWTFQVCDYRYQCGKKFPRYFASIKMTVELNKATYFVFNINDSHLADKYKCNVDTLRAAAEVVFVTKILKCDDEGAGCD